MEENTKENLIDALLKHDVLHLGAYLYCGDKKGAANVGKPKDGKELVDDSNKLKMAFALKLSTIIGKGMDAVNDLG
jgi:hypothetical protein